MSAKNITQRAGKKHNANAIDSSKWSTEFIPSQQNLDLDDGKSDLGMSSLRGDYCNVLVLLFLYVLQGIPLGLAGSIPLILQNKKVG